MSRHIKPTALEIALFCDNLKKSLLEASLKGVDIAIVRKDFNEDAFDYECYGITQCSTGWLAMIGQKR